MSGGAQSLGAKKSTGGAKVTFKSMNKSTVANRVI
jgi:hypothetical protein